MVAPLIASKGFREEYEGHYVLEDTDEVTVQYLIEWAYTKDYSVQHPPMSRIDGEPFLSYARVYVLADKYLLDGLKDLSFSKLTTAIKNVRLLHPSSISISISRS